MYRILFLAGIIGILLVPTAFAQFSDNNLASDVSIKVTPENPQPMEPVILEVKSYSVDLDQATIVWRYGGKVIASGVGKTKISTVAPASNTAALITATVSGAGFALSTVAITLQTASVDLLWEAADSYVPAFYKGKALLSPNGLVKITAIPTRSAPKNVVFEWSRNSSVDQDNSGYNKNSFVFKNATLQQQENVSVIAQSGAYSGTNRLTLNPSRPEIILYQKEDGFIDYNSGHISDMATDKPGVTLRFEPYFFSIPRSISKDLEFEIKNNDNQLYGNREQNELSLSRPDNGGKSIIEVAVNTTLYSLQNALSQFSILFK